MRLCGSLSILWHCLSLGLEWKLTYAQAAVAAAGALSTARSYPTSEVRDSGLECQALTVQERLRGATPRLRPGAVPESRGGGQKEQPHARGQGGYWEEQPHAQGVVAARAQEGLEEPSHVEGQEGRREEIPLIQSKKQQLRFAGAAVKRYPTPKAKETQVR